MKIIRHGTSYPKKLIRRNLIEKNFLIGFMLLFSISYLFFSFKNINTPNAESFVILFSMLLGVLLCLFCIWILRKIDQFFIRTENNLGKARAGNEGEKVVCDELKRILDNNYVAYQNFKIPGRRFDVDFLILGPKGLIAMEVKNSSSHFSFSTHEAIRIKGKGYTQEVTRLTGDFDPRVKLKNHCKSLNYYFYLIGLKEVRVKKVLVFVGGSIGIEGKAGIYIVKKLGELNKYFESLDNDNRFTPEFCASVSSKLKNHRRKR